MEPEPERERDEEVPEVLWDRIAWSIDLVEYEDFDLVRAARERYEPLMMMTLRDVASDPARYAAEPGHHGHQCALAFLAEFRAAAAFPAILQFLAGIRGFEDDLFPGHMITLDLPSILASTYDGNLAAMKSLVEDGRVDEFVGGAAVAAIGILARREKVERNDLSAYLGWLIQTRPREPSMILEESVRLILQLRFAGQRRAVEELITSEVVEGVTPDDVVSAFEDDTFPSADVRDDLIEDAAELVDAWENSDWGSEPGRRRPGRA